MIAADRIDRSTLVWNPAMPQWAAASTTDLAGLFGAGPPPLPATEISRWAVYALAFFPLIGVAIQAVASAAISARSGQDVQEVFDHRAWLLLFLIGNGVLGDLDERNLRHAGLKLRGATNARRGDETNADHWVPTTRHVRRHREIGRRVPPPISFRPIFKVCCLSRRTNPLRGMARHRRCRRVARA